MFNKPMVLFKTFLEHKRYLWIGALFFVSCFSAASISERSSNYQASATLLITSHPFLDVSTVGGEEKRGIMDVQIKMTYDFHRQLLQNPLLLEKTIAKLKRSHPAFKPVLPIKVDVRKISEDSALFKLSLAHEEAVLVLNTFIELYLAEYFEDRIKEKEKFLEKMQERLTSLEEIIIRQEMELFEMGESENRERVSPVERLTHYFRSLKDIRQKMKEASLNEEIVQRIETEEPLSGFSLSKKQQEYAALHHELKMLSRKYKSGYPPLAKLRGQIHQQRNQLRSEKEKLKEEEGVLIEKIGSIRKQVLMDSAGNDKSYTALVRSLDLNKKTYLQLNESVQKVWSRGFHQSTDIQILSLAQMSEAKSPFGFWVKKILGLVIVLLLTLIGMVYAMEWHEKQKSSEKQTPMLNLKMLGALPAVKIKKDKGGRHAIHVILDQNPDHPLCNEIKRINNQLLIQAQTKNVKTVLFTHMGVQSRNINIMSNLGIAMAQRNKKVLLIDASWHHPFLDTIFALENSVGLLNVLLKEVELGQAIQMTEIPNLHVLPTGSSLPLTFELLSSPFMKVVLDQATTLFDFVFIEAPSCFEHMDIFTLAQYAQGVVLVWDGREKMKSMLAYKSGLNRGDVEGLVWMGRVDLNQKMTWQ